MMMTYLANDIQRAHEYRVHVSVLHQLCMILEGVFERGPNLALDVLLDNA